MCVHECVSQKSETVHNTMQLGHYFVVFSCPRATLCSNVMHTDVGVCRVCVRETSDSDNSVSNTHIVFHLSEGTGSEVDEVEPLAFVLCFP